MLSWCYLCFVNVNVRSEEELTMAWKTPVVKEIACGMEINMYGPAEDERHDEELF